MENFEQNRDNKILFDWFAFTVHDLSLDEVFNLLGFSNLISDFITMSGSNGYKDRYYFDSISIHYNGHPGQGIHVNMSGQGCRAFETYSDYGDWIELFYRISQLKYKICRLDVAYDDFKSLLPINDIAEALKLNDWTSPASVRWYEAVWSYSGISAYVGSPGSRLRIRFYDKAAEQKVDYQWVRCEIQLRDEQATDFLAHYIKKPDDLSYIYFAVLNRYVRFIDRNKSNVSRSKVKQWWSDFIETEDTIKLWSPGVTYNIGRLKDNVISRWGNAIQSYISVFGIADLMQQLDEVRPLHKLPVHYKTIVKDYAEAYSAAHSLKETTLPDGTVIEEVRELPKRLSNALDKIQFSMED